MKRLLIISVLISTFSSCKIVHSLNEMNKEKARLYSYKVNDKAIKFIPMHHLGKKEFFDDVKKNVTTCKKNGYTVFYELLTIDFTADSLVRDTILRKGRKLKGFTGTFKENLGEVSFFDRYIQQPSYRELGTDNNDLRADVNYLQFINEWEKINGKITLDSTDFHTPFGEKCNKGVFYSKKQYNKIFIEYRNSYLINLIKTSSDNKVLILYGAGHRKNFKKQLKKINEN